jgi:enoyl-CoA hydratase
MYETILVATDGPVATLTFNRPEKLNAINVQMLQEVKQALAAIRADAAIRVLILTGQGRAFVAGADVRQFLEFDSRRAYEFSRQAQAVVAQLEELPIPVLAAVNGFALGGGCEIALACDLIYASEKATFGQPEINLGLMPGLGGSQRLARLVGKGLAKDLCLTGRAVTAREALAMGLAARVFPPDELLPQCRRLAQEVAAKSPFALGQIKKVINAGFDLPLASALELEAQAFGLCFATPAPQEGVQAFLEKRAARFSA